MRPFYTDYAWAADLLIDRPVRKECATIAAWLIERGVLPGATVLDAGCGAGRYGRELSRRGYAVHGIDASPDLIAEARRAAGGAPSSLSFSVGDIRRLPADRYEAILCRGVLNDVVEDEDRRAVFASFACALRPGGVLILDVREWEATATRKGREPLFRKSVPTDRGTLTFTSVTDPDPVNRRILISETHTLDDGRRERSCQYSFVMRCWTQDELHSSLSVSGFASIGWFGAYESTIPPGSTDRLIAVAELSTADARTALP